MKKFLITLLVAALLASALVFSASAAGYQETAEQLSELGLLQGSDGDFQLGRQPTRAEAITMLVRLLGLEEEARSGEYSHPFTDAPDWASPYIAIAYELGYTTGATETTFEPQGICSSQMYVTFVARALGYSDDDVATTLWAESLDFGKAIGIIDDILLSDASFMRGHMAVVSYLALSVRPASGMYDTLLQKLVDDGAVDAADAARQLERFALIDEFLQIGSELQDVTSIAMVCEMSMDMTMMGMTIPMYVFLDAKVIVDDFDLDCAMAMEMSAPNTDGEMETQSTEMYMTDGYIYVSAEGEKVKMPLDSALGGMSMEDLLAMTDLAESLAPVAVYPSYMISSITKGTAGAGLTLYTVEFSSDVFNGLVAQIFGMLGDVGMGELGGLDGIYVDNVVVKFYTRPTGELNRMQLSADMAMSIMGFDAYASMDFDYSIYAKGADVIIEFPDDLDEYIELDVLHEMMQDLV